MKGADPIGTAEVAFQCLEQSAKSLRSTFRNRKDPSELGDFALTGADPAGALHAYSRGQFASEIGKPAGVVYTLADEGLAVLAAFITLVLMASSCVVSFLVCFAIEQIGGKVSAFFLLHPLPNIGRTVLELDAIGFGIPKKTDDVLIHEG